ncbi:DUF1858 domain-containing protein [Sedimentibacter sp.]|uniref:DUF1858 domain-containing protein n=1 Tax=Sedimentibacter sp. TaxID=1960295 RepID=UPI0028AD5AF3|nr:DUF1858 domain-containing protein [Sedimentibacter sp.]
MSKIIDINKSVYELCKEYPELQEILASIGFKDITLPGMINMAGRIMTLPKGSKAKGIPMEKIKEELVQRGFEIKE